MAQNIVCLNGRNRHSVCRSGSVSHLRGITRWRRQDAEEVLSVAKLCGADLSIVDILTYNMMGYCRRRLIHCDHAHES
jgi:hypothetical protein